MESEVSNSGEFVYGRWNDEEQQQFISGIMRYGKDWKRVETIVRTRNSSQIRSHAQKFFLKVQHIRKIQKKNKYKNKTKSSLFSEEETKLLAMLRSQPTTDRTPAEISSLLNEHTRAINPRKSPIEKQNELIGNPPELHFKNQSESPESLSNRNLHLLGIPIEKPQIFQDQLRNRYQEQYSKQSYFLSLIRKNFGRFLCASELIDFVDIPKGHEKVTKNYQKNSKLESLPDFQRRASKSYMEIEEQRKDISKLIAENPQHDSDPYIAHY